MIVIACNGCGRHHGGFRLVLRFSDSRARRSPGARGKFVAPAKESRSAPAHELVRCRERALRPCVLMSLCLVCAMFAQNPDYAFYSEDFRPWLQSLPREKSAIRLPPWRRTQAALQNDWWNSYFTSNKSNFNREPNSFLVESTRGRTPGTALDMGPVRAAILCTSPRKAGR